ncbi:MAG: hypothetical protein SNH01_04185 [Rikenellaceae bacterium]
MRKLFSFFTIALLSAAVVSCDKYEDFDDYGFTDTYTGLLLIDQVYETNAYAMDGLSVAMRFAILQGEMAASNLAFDADGNLVDGDGTPQSGWSAIGTYTFANYSTKDYNKKHLLFSLNGEGGDISRLESGSDKFTVTYGLDDGTHTQGALDNVLRKGTYIIDTKGKKLSETTASTDDCWEVTLLNNSSDSEMTFATSTSYASTASIKVEESDTEDEYRYRVYLYMSSDGVITYMINYFAGRYSSYSATATWGVSGSVTLPGIAIGQDITMTNTISAEIQHQVSSTGITLAQSYMTYQTIANEGVGFYNTPLKYIASTTYLQPCGGSEYVQQWDSDGGSIIDFVTRKFYSTGEYLVTYNGYTYPNNLVVE